MPKSNYNFAVAKKVWDSHISGGMKLKDAAIKHGMKVNDVSNYVSRYLQERKDQLKTK